MVFPWKLIKPADVDFAAPLAAVDNDDNDLGFNQMDKGLYL